jgi:hypothetical protein
MFRNIDNKKSCQNLTLANTIVFFVPRSNENLKCLTANGNIFCYILKTVLKEYNIVKYYYYFGTFV